MTGSSTLTILLPDDLADNSRFCPLDVDLIRLLVIPALNRVEARSTSQLEVVALLAALARGSLDSGTQFLALKQVDQPGNAFFSSWIHRSFLIEFHCPPSVPRLVDCMDLVTFSLRNHPW